MEKRIIYGIVTLLIVLILFFAYKLGILKLGGMFIGFGGSHGEFKWWNVSWRYRFRLEINSTGESRSNWPIEYHVNFTDLIPSGAFDENSTRVVEYDSNGNILFEVPSQFDKDDNFDASNNAVGTIIFIMNGTSQANSKRIFYIYYDTLDRPKESPNYQTNLTYHISDDNRFVDINSTNLRIYIDTNRGQNVSGIYRVERTDGAVILSASSNDKPAEYLEYSNGTYNFTFDFRNNITVVSGPVRITVKQEGYENILGEPDNKTNELFVKKRYYIYNLAGPMEKGSFIKVKQDLTNLKDYSIERNSTDSGALALDLNRTFPATLDLSTVGYNYTNPYSYVKAGTEFENYFTGVINLNQTNTTNFFAKNATEQLGRIGIHLNTTSISSSQSISELALVYFGAYTDPGSEFENIRRAVSNPVELNSSLPERMYVEITPETNETTYNRNESMLIIGRITDDPYNLTEYVNATFDMGTTSKSDDQTIILYDDGTHGDEAVGDKNFTNTFDIPADGAIGVWTINITTYTANSEFLNSSIITFNVTDVLNVTLDIHNKKPVTGSLVTANVYVKNYREDSWISGATLNCSFDSTEVTNKTDYNNGTYSINFTAPSNEGTFLLACNATKNGNFGNASDYFTTEPAKVNITITSEPSNPIVSGVTINNNGSFTILVNATNTENGTAYSTNITLELLSGWNANTSLAECGDIEKHSFCAKGFNVTVPNGTSPGNYYINVTATWRNPDSSIDSNKTQVNVTVESNPVIDVEQSKISGETGDGIWTLVGNFTVHSIGNDLLQNITFTCISGDVCNNFTVKFIPENISNLTVGSEKNVSINISVPLAYSPGTYNGTVNVTTENDGFDTFILEAIVPAKTNVSIITDISNYTAFNITQQDNETFIFQSNTTNIGNGSARFTNISLSLPSGWSSNSTLENCENLLKGDICSKEFKVTIPKATSPGNYLVNMTVNWTNPDNSLGINETSISVLVASNPVINISVNNISGTVPDATEQILGNFTALSVGNDVLQNISFSCYSGIVCQNFTVEFVPPNISNLPMNENQSIMVNVSVPLNYDTGNYTGIVNVSAGNDGYKNLTLKVEVPPNRTWSMSPTYCKRTEYPEEGTVCEVTIKNLGNDIINFTISPEEGNYTKVNVTSFSIQKGSNYTFKVIYNVTGVPQGVYNSTFTVDAVQLDANPDNQTLTVSLMPYSPPLISLAIVPSSAEQNDYVEFYVNVTDRSGSNIAWTKVNVTRPDGIVDSANMTLVSVNGNFSQWYRKYPDSWGNTTKQGTYIVTVFSQDNVGNLANVTSNFTIYPKLSIISTTLSDKYLQGDTGSIYYVVRDINGVGLSNISVTFTILDSNQNITYYNVFQTNEDGTITPMPSFSLSSDAPLGNYTLISNSTYNDPTSGLSFSVQKNSTFTVESRTITVSGLFADLETAVVWYPDNVMKFGILTYNGEGKPVDPTGMNLTVLDPAGNLYFSTDLSHMTREATGYYTYSYAMPSDTPSGMFLAYLNATQDEFTTQKLKAFRVAHGGPYDLWIKLLEHEVKQDSYLDFEVNIENKGEVTQDVFLEWWVASENKTYFYNSGWVLTPKFSNQTITKQAYIFPTQPLGTYTLNVKMTYDTVQSPLIANTTFVVLAKQVLPNITVPNVTPYVPPVVPPIYVTPAAVIPTPTAPIPAKILITKYNSNISIAQGMSDIESVTVKNIGEVNLDNVSLILFGIPYSWYNITPESYKTLPPENSSVFLINFNIPENAGLGPYTGTLTAVSGVVSDQKSITLNVFKSIKDVLEDELRKVKEDLAKLEYDTEVARTEGKDVAGVLILISEAKTQITLAEGNIRKGNYEEALANLATAKRIIERARTLLSQLKVITTKFVFPLWIILLILGIIIGTVVILIILSKKKKIPPLRPYLIPIGKIAEIVKKKEAPKKAIPKEKERERLMRMLNIIEKEKAEGLISITTYREMKKNIEKKLKKLK